MRTIREAVWPQDLERARELLRHYQASLHGGVASICLRGFDEELAALDRRWGPPHAALLLASAGETVVGCVALQLLPDRARAAEMKRMWVEPEGRGHGAGRALCMAAMSWAQRHAAQELLLDTVPAAMPAAHRLYLSLGFEPADRYNTNDVADVVFYRRPLV